MPEAPESLCAVANRGEELRRVWLNEFFGQQAEAVLHALRSAEAAFDESFRGQPYFRLSDAVREAWSLATAGMDAEHQQVWAAILLSDLIAQTPQRLLTRPAPEPIIPHIGNEFSRILDELERQPGAPRGLEDDLFVKDFGLCRLDAFPCVAQIVTKNSGIPRTTAALEFFRAPSDLARIGMQTRFRYRPFFEIHTHTPMLGGFTPEGWDWCYALTADLLKTYPEYQGLIGASWFYDPKLERVSPRLSYLREQPLGGGAFLLRMGQSRDDVANATATSESRRRLYQSGEYRPTRWMMVWLREPLLNWVDANRDRICGTPVVLRPR